jgi:tRNA U34 5-methylaminomethyl-2-thiouridine-forming methyltransferase MnmC
MTRTPHDQFAKQYLAELLAPWGEVDIGNEVSPEVREVDVWFVPSPSPATDPQVLGLLVDILPSRKAWGFWDQTAIAGVASLTSPNPAVDAPTAQILRLAFSSLPLTN